MYECTDVWMFVPTDVLMSVCKVYTYASMYAYMYVCKYIYIYIHCAICNVSMYQCIWKYIQYICKYLGWMTSQQQNWEKTVIRKFLSPIYNIALWVFFSLPADCSSYNSLPVPLCLSHSQRRSSSRWGAEATGEAWGCPPRLPDESIQLMLMKNLFCGPARGIGCGRQEIGWATQAEPTSTRMRPTWRLQKAPKAQAKVWTKQQGRE
jgi:hypothetical protein